MAIYYWKISFVQSMKNFSSSSIYDNKTIFLRVLTYVNTLIYQGIYLVHLTDM